VSVVATTELAACRAVTVTYGHGESAVSVLSDIDLTLAEGERVGLWGPSGSGKTTLLHVLGGLITPTSGEVEWRGAPLSSLDAAARGHVRSRGIAYVFQGANLLPTLTAFENVSFAAHAAARDETGLGAGELLDLVGLDAKLDALPSELSGGEAQRVAIARALAQRPALFLCDEPTGQLDSGTGGRVLDLIDALHEEFGFAQVTATHAAEVAGRFDRAIGLSDGRLTGEAQLR
jgi:ABC-type lipoprotein export system ATPase subunit